MRVLHLIILPTVLAMVALPAWAAENPVPEIGATGTLSAVTIVAAVAAIIIERRRK